MSDAWSGTGVGPTRARLRITDPDGAESQMLISRAPATLGRSKSADVQLDSAHVSRRHAELYRDPFGRWWVRDLMSRAGTKVNGEDVTDSVVTPGDRVEIGGFTVTLEDIVAPSGDGGAGSLGEAVDEELLIDEDASSVSSIANLQGSRIEVVHLATLKEFGDRLLRTSDTTERLRVLCRLLTRKDFHGRGAVALRLERKDPRLRDPAPSPLCETQTPSGNEEDPGMHLSRTLLRSVYESGLPMLATHDSADPGAVELSVTWSKAPVVAMACPLRQRTDDDQTMDVIYATFPIAYGDAQWLTLLALAAQQYQQTEAVLAAQARAREHAMIEQDLVQARKIQMGYVPRQQEVHDLEIAIGFEPCRWVGGDLVDVIRTDTGCVLLVADVAGKGLPAALITSNIYSMARACVRSGVDLRTTFDNLNDHLCEFMGDASFVTLVAAAFDPQHSKIQLVNAGHPAPVIIGLDGKPRRLREEGNLPLGIMPQTTIVIDASLEPGEIAVMYTDGLSELRNEEGVMLGTQALTEHLARICHEARDQPLSDVADAIAAFLDETRGDRVADDDRTFLLARRTGS